MKELRSVDQKVYIQNNFLNIEQIKNYTNKLTPFPEEKRKECSFKNPMWELRTVDITHDPVVDLVKNFLNKRFDLDLKIQQAQIQNWIKDSYSPLHAHGWEWGNRGDTRFNSLIYLNDNFTQGNFYTSMGIVVKPEPGLLTFFDGKKVHHGVSQVRNKDRYTLIFWWKE
tara:strand:+ start:3185 stop:3691 length:507 start_codon:yes stop_codon:yes gene_type:complete